MGYAVSWMAIKGKTKDSLLEKLGLKATGTIVEVEFEYNFAGFAANEWYLLTMSDVVMHLFLMSISKRYLRGTVRFWLAR